MRTHTILAVSVAAFALQGVVSAGQVWINSGQIANIVQLESVANSKYRLSQGNFDMSIDHGAGTNPGQFISANLGNNSALSNVAFNFTVQHIAGEGVIFTMTNTNSSVTTTLSWGDFSAAPEGTTAGLLNGFAPDRSFNSLELSARAERIGSSMAFSGLTFSSGLSVADGAFYNGEVSTPGVGSDVQRLVSDTDLSTIDWTLTGTLMGARDTSASGDETVRFMIGHKQVAFSVIPLPTPAGLAVAGLLAIPALRRRRAC